MLTAFCALQASDNTRHRARHPRTGQPFLAPPERIRRVLLCTGGIFYAASAARRARRINDVVLVRLEQLAPFPHDLVVQVRLCECHDDCVALCMCAWFPGLGLCAWCCSGLRFAVPLRVLLSFAWWQRAAAILTC